MGERGASVIVGAVCAVLWGGLSLWRFAHLQTGMDLVIFHQGLANLTAGRAPLVPIKGEQVFWSFPNLELAASRTDDDGFAEVRFILPAWDSVSATVRGGSSWSLRL